MNDEQITTSVAMFFAPEPCWRVPYEWFVRARQLFSKYRLSPILFTAYGGEFLHDDCYVLAKSGNDTEIWGEELPAREEELADTLRSGRIESLGLDSPRPGATDRSDWRVRVSVSELTRKCYLGVDESIVSQPVALARQASKILQGLLDVRYGFAYKMLLEECPDSYASGRHRTTFSEVREMIRHRRNWDKRQKTPDELWEEELYGQRRHLSGLFRGAYPASILSEAHVRAADLASHPIGELSQLDSALWLWELADSEIPTAQAMLENKKLLVSQAVEP